jgi:hypothetical protein
MRRRSKARGLLRSLLAIVGVLLTPRRGPARGRIGQIALTWLIDDEYQPGYAAGDARKRTPPTE